MKNADVFVVKVILRVKYRILLLSVRRLHLHQPKFPDVSGDRRLGYMKAFPVEIGRQFLLRGNVMLTDEFNDFVNLYFFAQISYSELKDNGIEKGKEYTETQAPKCSFLLKNQNDGDSIVYDMIIPEKTLDLYSKGKKFEAKNK